MYTLTAGQFQQLQSYFELALTAISDDEQDELVHREKPLRDMLRQVRQDQDV